MPNQYYIGWDVAGWHTNRDSLCVLTENDSCLELVGSPWRGNLRRIICEETGWRLLAGILRYCCVEIDRRSELTLAIDAPLGWPESTICLLECSDLISVGRIGRENPYLFRETEMFLKGKGFQPKSVVSDRIGSPSTKAIHFLNVSGLQPPSEVGVWETCLSQNMKVTAIETYPMICKKNCVMNNHFSNLVECQHLDESINDDIYDAIYCALVAWKFATDKEWLQAPEKDIPVEEGWIWVPKDALRRSEDGECTGSEKG